MTTSTCYFFGTFNPIHIGHLLMANQALGLYGNVLGFDTVTFIPAGNPPHRQDEPGLLDARQRFHLIEQAIYGFSNLRVSAVELEMAKESVLTYTYNTLQRLQALEESKRCLMLMGQDSFESLPTWYQGDTLLKRCTFIVLQRPSDTKTIANKGIQSDLMGSFVDYHPLEIPPIAISATYIRELCKDKPDNLRQRLTGLMPPHALEYFLNNHLYSN